MERLARAPRTLCIHATLVGRQWARLRYKPDTWSTVRVPGLPPSCGIVTDYRTYTAYCGYICKHYKSSVCFVSLLLFVCSILSLSLSRFPTPFSFSLFPKAFSRFMSRPLGIALLLPRHATRRGVSFIRRDTPRRQTRYHVVTGDCPREKNLPDRNSASRLRSGCPCRGTRKIQIRPNAGNSDFTTCRWKSRVFACCTSRSLWILIFVKRWSLIC